MRGIDFPEEKNELSAASKTFPMVNDGSIDRNQNLRPSCDNVEEAQLMKDS